MTIKILVVDDESDVELLINVKFRKYIKDGEYHFYFARNGKEALDLLREDSEIDIIFTDLNMPLMDGLTLLSNLSSLERPYKAVVVSAYGDLSNIRTAMNRGASDFIIKPINFDDFLITLKKMIDEIMHIKAEILLESHLKEIEAELSIAKGIQQTMLPSNFNPFPEHSIDIAGKMTPAKLVGGDFFDFFPIDDKNLGIIIADVSGKNISACLYMVIARSLFRAFSQNVFSASELVKSLDRYLSDDNISCMFVTAVYAILNVTTGELSCCNAGHNPPYIIKNNGSIIKLELTGGRALGVNIDSDLQLPEFENVSLKLDAGDCLFLYTDGVTEAMDTLERQFTQKRLEDSLAHLAKKSASEIVENVFEDVRKFTHEAIQSDDITMLAVRFKTL